MFAVFQHITLAVDQMVFSPPTATMEEFLGTLKLGLNTTSMQLVDDHPRSHGNATLSMDGQRLFSRHKEPIFNQVRKHRSRRVRIGPSFDSEFSSVCCSIQNALKPKRRQSNEESPHSMFSNALKPSRRGSFDGIQDNLSLDIAMQHNKRKLMNNSFIRVFENISLLEATMLSDSSSSSSPAHTTPVPPGVSDRWTNGAE